MTTYDWLLLCHILAAFLFLSGAIAAGLIHALAMRRDRPSEIAVLMGLIRPIVAVIGVGSLGALGFGIWLLHETNPIYGFGDEWLIAAFVLWAISGALAGQAGEPLREARELAETLAADGDQPNEQLKRPIANPRVIVLNYASLAAILAILVLMVRPAREPGVQGH